MKKAKNLLDSKGSDVWSVTPQSTVLQAIKVMAEKRIGALLVMNGSELCGVFSERDYARKVILKGISSSNTPVSDIMTREVVVAKPEHTVEECMALMTEKRVRHLPVVEGDAVIGVLSIGDLVKSIIEDQQFTIEQLENYITTGY